MKRSTIVSGAGLLVIAALVGYCQARTTQLSAAFEKVVVGDTERDVVIKMSRMETRLTRLTSCRPDI
jgi:hypothetical protein